MPVLIGEPQSGLAHSIKLYSLTITYTFAETFPHAWQRISGLLLNIEGSHIQYLTFDFVIYRDPLHIQFYNAEEDLGFDLKPINDLITRTAFAGLQRAKIRFHWHILESEMAFSEVEAFQAQIAIRMQELDWNIRGVLEMEHLVFFFEAPTEEASPLPTA
ncbi:hypothetical protein AcW1_002584 [Taiwanofungus camphoratus]|nr:hypothetical protein AcW1_002584 [Antrodia cinnamomea]